MSSGSASLKLSPYASRDGLGTRGLRPGLAACVLAGRPAAAAGDARGSRTRRSGCALKAALEERCAAVRHERAEWGERQGERRRARRRASSSSTSAPRRSRRSSATCAPKPPRRTPPRGTSAPPHGAPARAHTVRRHLVDARLGAGCAAGPLAGGLGAPPAASPPCAPPAAAPAAAASLARHRGRRAGEAPLVSDLIADFSSSRASCKPVATPSSRSCTRRKPPAQSSAHSSASVFRSMVPLLAKSTRKPVVRLEPAARRADAPQRRPPQKDVWAEDELEVVTDRAAVVGRILRRDGRASVDREAPLPPVGAPRNAVASTFAISVYPTAATRVWSAVQPSARKSWTSCGTSFARCSALPPGTPIGGDSDGRWSMTRRRLAAVGEVKSSATHSAMPTTHKRLAYARNCRKYARL